MTINEFSEKFSSLIKENSHLLIDLYESFPSEMKKKVEEELKKVKQQILEDENKKEQ